MRGKRAGVEERNFCISWKRGGRKKVVGKKMSNGTIPGGE